MDIIRLDESESESEFWGDSQGQRPRIQTQSKLCYLQNSIAIFIRNDLILVFKCTLIEIIPLNTKVPSLF